MSKHYSKSRNNRQTSVQNLKKTTNQQNKKIPEKAPVLSLLLCHQGEKKEERNHSAEVQKVHIQNTQLTEK